MRSSDWSSDVCSSDLRVTVEEGCRQIMPLRTAEANEAAQRDRLGSVVHLHFVAVDPGVAVAEPLVTVRLESDARQVEKWKIGRACVGKECVSTCRSRWSQ